jgi:hypothetical protein
MWGALSGSPSKHISSAAHEFDHNLHVHPCHLVRPNERNVPTSYSQSRLVVNCAVSGTACPSGQYLLTLSCVVAGLFYVERKIRPISKFVCRIVGPKRFQLFNFAVRIDVTSKGTLTHYCRAAAASGTIHYSVPANFS